MLDYLHHHATDPWTIFTLIVFIGAYVFTWALCRAAAIGDEQLDYYEADLRAEEERGAA